MSFEIVVDDFGASQLINNAILKQLRIRPNSISRVSLLINLRELHNENWQELKKTEAKTAIHLNLSEGPSLANESKWICGRDGNFKFDAKELLVLSIFKPTLVYEIVYQEFSKQLTKYRLEFGETNLFINSHQHVHILPVVRSAFLNVLRDLKIDVTSIRIPHERIPKSIDSLLLKQFLLNGNVLKYLLSKLTCKQLEKSLMDMGISFSDEFFGLLNSGFANHNYAFEFFDEYALRKDNKHYEILFHIAEAGQIGREEPSFTRTSLRKFYQSKERQKEWTILKELSESRDYYL